MTKPGREKGEKIQRTREPNPRPRDQRPDTLTTRPRRLIGARHKHTQSQQNLVLSRVASSHLIAYFCGSDESPDCALLELHRGEPKVLKRPQHRQPKIPPPPFGYDQSPTGRSVPDQTSRC